MKIEKGKFYRTRDGRKVEILKTDVKNIYPVVGLITHNEDIELSGSWISNGKFVEHLEEHVCDIISEWEEALDFDPYCLPKWANKWIAMDADGSWRSYSKKPTPVELDQTWNTYREELLIPERFNPKNYKGDWKDSLFNVNRLKTNPFKL